MRRTIPGMAPSLQIGQTLLGRSGVPYHLREVLYERKENKDVVHRLWVAWYAPPSTYLNQLTRLR